MGIKSDTAVGILSKSIAQHPCLRLLNVSYNEITLRGCKLLRDAVSAAAASSLPQDDRSPPASPRQRLLLSVEGNSGEKKPTGVAITGGYYRPARPPMLM